MTEIASNMGLRLGQDVAPKDGEAYPFGIQSKRLSAELRNLADRIDEGKVAPQKVKVSVLASQDDFTTSLLTVLFVERRSVDDEFPR